MNCAETSRCLFSSKVRIRESAHEQDRFGRFLIKQISKRFVEHHPRREAERHDAEPCRCRRFAAFRVDL